MKRNNPIEELSTKGYVYQTFVEAKEGTTVFDGIDEAIDNAIDASSECDEKVINIIFRDDAKNHRQLIIIENTYKDKNVDTEKIFDK